jgi:hypothetical protein
MYILSSYPCPRDELDFNYYSLMIDESSYLPHHDGAIVHLYNLSKSYKFKESNKNLRTLF